jgi:antirestriction protein
MLANSPTPGAEEWAIFVTNGFGPLDINEYEQLEVVNRIAKGIEAHGVAFAHYVELVGTDELDDLDRFEECFLGRYDTFEEYVENLIDDLGYREAIDAPVPPGLEGYVDIDVEGLARDMSMSGIYATAADADGVYVFDMGR